MVIVSSLSHAEIGSNDHRADTSHFTKGGLWYSEEKPYTRYSPYNFYGGLKVVEVYDQVHGQVYVVITCAFFVSHKIKKREQL